MELYINALTNLASLSNRDIVELAIYLKYTSLLVPPKPLAVNSLNEYKIANIYIKKIK